MTPRKKTLELMLNELGKIKKPFVIYSATYTSLNAALAIVDTGADMPVVGHDVLNNAKLILPINLGYAFCVDMIVRNCGKYGRLVANMFSVGVASSFYAYALMTND